MSAPFMDSQPASASGTPRIDARRSGAREIFPLDFAEQAIAAAESDLSQFPPILEIVGDLVDSAG